VEKTADGGTSRHGNKTGNPLISDLEQSTRPETRRADVCIVGAGAAGIALAVELSRGGRHVALLESGGLGEEDKTQNLYRSEIVGLKHEGIHFGRHRLYGGSTTKWGGQILELFDDDFEAHSWIKGSGWPIRKKVLEPYYARALALEGLGQATTNDLDVWREAGLEPPDLSASLASFFSRWCREPNFTRLFGRVLASEENLQVYLHANACEMLLAEDGESIRGVRVRTLSGKETVVTANRYVLCQGGIETCRFLLQPHAGGRAPWHQNPLLGRHFQDHLDVYCADLTNVHPRLFPSYFDPVCTRGYRYEPRFRLPLKRRQEAGLLNIGGMVFFESPPDDTRHRNWQTMKLLVRGRLREVAAADLPPLATGLPTLFHQIYRYLAQGRGYHPPKIRARLRVFCEQEPLGESRITLSSQKDAVGLFRSRLDWRVSELELKTIRQFVSVVQQAFAERQLAGVIPDPDLAENPENFVSKIMDSYHHMGGVRMAVAASQGLVDLDLKLHGTRNAYVCSSAVFPTSGFSNPTHTLLALAVRLADHLKDLPS
jgi:choline dehydrogenase-like flavoprotein